LTLDGGRSTNFGHYRKIVLALPIAALTLCGTTAQPKAFKFFPAMSAVDIETPIANPHWATISPAIDFLGL
jgi:hypothetical protein